MDRVFAVHIGSRGFDPHRRHMSEQFFRSNRPVYPHPVYSELVNSGIRVAVGDLIAVSLSVGGGVRLIKPAKLYANTLQKHNEDGRTAPGVYGNGSVPLSHSGNEIGLYTCKIGELHFLFEKKRKD